MVVHKREGKPSKPRLSAAQKRKLRAERAAKARAEGLQERSLIERSRPAVELHVRLGFSDSEVGRDVARVWLSTIAEAKRRRIRKVRHV